MSAGVHVRPTGFYMTMCRRCGGFDKVIALNQKCGSCLKIEAWPD